MKKRLIQILALILVFSLLCAFTPIEIPNPEEDVAHPNAVCIYCGKGTVSTKCLDDWYYYTSGPGTHLPSSGCTVSFYRATSMEWCSSCFKNNGTNGAHDCYRVHSSCGRGKVWTCVEDAAVSGDW